jgi:hypothetical protein
MTDEETKARRVAVANKIRVKASPLRMPLDEFNATFKERQVLADAKQRDEMESATQQMFCDACLTENLDNFGRLEGTLLHVRMEDDPLGNFWKLATMRCFNCGFHEHVPLTRPEFDPNQLASAAGGLLGRQDFTAGVVCAPDEYLEEMRRQAEVQMRQQTAAKVQAQQAANQQRMAALQNQLAHRGWNMTATELRARMNASLSQMGANIGQLGLAQEFGGDIDDLAKYMDHQMKEAEKKVMPPVMHPDHWGQRVLAKIRGR